MKKAINIWAFPGGLAGEKDIVDAMREAKEVGFAGIELSIAAEGMLTHKTSEARCRSLRKAAREIGIEIVGVATGQLWAWPLTDPSKRGRERARTFVAAALERTAWFGAKAVLVVPIGDDDVNFPEVLKALKRIRYTGPITAEVLNFTGDTNVVARTHREMDGVLDGA